MSVVLARTIRSGVVEAEHDGWAVAVDENGEILEAFGDVTRPLLYRSAVKPFQAHVSQRNGASLGPEQMAMVCSSHDALPVHLAIVSDLLTGAGLDESDLGCPPSEPNSLRRRLDLARRGEPRARPIYHACSGKHAGFLRACTARGWPTASYLDPGHPLQREVLDEIARATRIPVETIAVDGCGAPAPAGTVVGLATAFAVLTVDPRYEEQCTAMARYPGLLSSNTREDGRIGCWWGGPVKRGAEGVIAAGRNGIGLAVKSRSGSDRIAAMGLVALMTRMGLLSDAARDALDGVARPPVLGAGRPVGALTPALGGDR